MNILLDTQVAIWALAAPERLSEKSRAQIAESQNSLFVSAVNVAEIAIKFRLSKRVGAPPFSGTRALDLFHAAGYVFLPLTAEVTAKISPRYPMQCWKDYRKPRPL